MSVYIVTKSQIANLDGTQLAPAGIVLVGTREDDGGCTVDFRGATFVVDASESTPLGLYARMAVEGYGLPKGAIVLVVRADAGSPSVVIRHGEHDEYVVSASDLIPTLAAIGRPWAKTYRGSGRFTGQLYADPELDNQGNVAPGWSWVGHWTQEEFLEECEFQNA